MLRKKERKAEERARKERLLSPKSEGNVGASSRRRKSLPTLGGLGTGTVSVVTVEDARRNKLDK